MSDNKSRRSVLKGIATSSVISSGLLAGTGVAAADQNYTVRVEWDGPSGETGEYHIYMDAGSDATASCDAHSNVEGDSDIWWDGTVLHIQDFLDESNDTADAWDCTSMATDVQIDTANTNNVDVYQDGVLIGSY